MGKRRDEGRKRREWLGIDDSVLIEYGGNRPSVLRRPVFFELQSRFNHWFMRKRNILSIGSVNFKSIQMLIDPYPFSSSVYFKWKTIRVY